MTRLFDVLSQDDRLGSFATVRRLSCGSQKPERAIVGAFVSNQQDRASEFCRMALAQATRATFVRHVLGFQMQLIALGCLVAIACAVRVCPW